MREAKKESGSIRLYLEDFTPFLVGSDADAKTFFRETEKKSRLYTFGGVCGLRRESA